jgi:sugar phosphate isomerase/epimerase
MHSIQIGCCCSVDQAEAARTAGFDYLECPLTGLLPEETDAAFAPVLESYQRAVLPVRAFNIFLPSNLKVVGPAVDQPRLARYVQSALRRARQIGAQLVVFGSGRSRSIPEDFSPGQALDQLVHFLQTAAAVAAQTGITIAIEPLNRNESNVINSVAEGVELARRVNRASIRVLADFYHMDEEAEALQQISQHAAWLAHIHVADTGRLAPGTGHYPYPAFAEQLRQIGYTGMISVECRWRAFAEEAGPAVDFLRRTFC